MESSICNYEWCKILDFQEWCDRVLHFYYWVDYFLLMETGFWTYILYMFWIMKDFKSPLFSTRQKAFVPLNNSSNNHRRRRWHPTPVLLPGKSHGWRSLVGCSPWGREESDTTERLHFPFSFHALEKAMAAHSSVLAGRIPGTREPGGLAPTGSHRVRHDWRNLAAAAIIITAFCFNF